MNPMLLVHLLGVEEAERLFASADADTVDDVDIG